MTAMQNHLATTSAGNDNDGDGEKLAEFTNEELQEFAQAFKVDLWLSSLHINV
jgi:hypothetical protein